MEGFCVPTQGKTTQINAKWTASVGHQTWDPSFPLENTKSPHPENPAKLLKNYNLAHPGPVLKMTAKNYPKKTKSVIF